MSSLTCVIFDCDGVLVDSEPITNAIFREMLADLGLILPQETFHRQFVGRSMKSCVEIITTHFHHPLPPDFVAQYHARILPALRDRVQPVLGIEQVLDHLDKQGLPYCVASSGDYTKMQTTLGATGLLSRFENRIFSAVDVPRGKPHPDLFLHAAAQMNADPSTCVVIEDSVPGVQAGVAAGMQVFAYAAASDPQPLAAAGGQPFMDMPALIPLLFPDSASDPL